MTTKDVLLVVGGVALGYWASTKKFGKNTASAVSEVATGVVGTATGVVTDVKDVVVDTAKKIECEKKWSDEIGSVSRFASPEALEKSKSDYVSTCLASK
jgi:hypothetical protein